LYYSYKFKWGENIRKNIIFNPRTMGWLSWRVGSHVTVMNARIYSRFPCQFNNWIRWSWGSLGFLVSFDIPFYTRVRTVRTTRLTPMTRGIFKIKRTEDNFYSGAIKFLEKKRTRMKVGIWKQRRCRWEVSVRKDARFFFGFFITLSP
jgi:hypothetical protein